MIGEERFRTVMGHFATGVTIVASRDQDGNAVGLTVNAFCSVSLSPPLVLVCVHRNADSHGPILEAGHFGVSVLRPDQADLAVRFSVEDSALRFKDVSVVEGVLGSPRIEGSLAWLQCRVRNVYPGGDHSIIVGEVVECEASEGPPLVFFRGSLEAPAR